MSGAHSRVGGRPERGIHMKHVRLIFVVTVAYLALLWLTLAQGFYIFRRPDTFPQVFWASLMEWLWNPFGWQPPVQGDWFVVMYSIVYSLIVGVCADILYWITHQFAGRPER